MQRIPFSIKIFFFVFILFNLSCEKNEIQSLTQLSSEKEILKVTFYKADNNNISADISGIIHSDTIQFIFPSGILLNNLIPTINFTGKSINPSNKTPQNFNNPVIYTISAEDGTTKKYLFRISHQLSDSLKLISGYWKIIRDSVRTEGAYVFRGSGGTPGQGVYYPYPNDYWFFGTNGIFSLNANYITGDSPYKILPGNKIDIEVWTWQYRIGTIEKLTQDSATFFWSDTLSNGATYFRKAWLKR